MKHVLVTGADGFVGRAVLASLVQHGWQVTAISRNPPYSPAGAIEWVAADLHDTAQTAQLLPLKQPTHLLHLAWYTEHGKYWNASDNLAWVKASLTLLRAFREHGGKRAVIAGTCAEYDWTHGYCVEDITPLNPRSLYGVCKNALRSILEHYLRDSDVSLAWGRIFFPYGPGEAPARLVPSVIRAILDGTAVRCTHGQQYRDFLHVADVAEAFCALLDSDTNSVFNIASGQPVQLQHVVSTIADLMNWNGALHFGALPAPSDDPPLLVGDNHRLSQLGWAPRIGLDQGLREAIEWWSHPRHHSRQERN